MDMDMPEEEYLLELWNKNICPNCGKSTPELGRVGSGRKADGGVCSLECYGEYHKATLVGKHKKRLALVARHQNS